MTTQEINVAIAESVGWHKVGERAESGKVVATYQLQTTIARHQRCDDNELPNYSSDLNAMHEVEKTLHDPRILEHEERHVDRYAFELLKLVATWPTNFTRGSVCDADFFKVANATASQRAEAYLRTIGKWKE